MTTKSLLELQEQSPRTLPEIIAVLEEQSNLRFVLSDECFDEHEREFLAGESSGLAFALYLLKRLSL
jgi:hypothetical protein